MGLISEKRIVKDKNLQGEDLNLNETTIREERAYILLSSTAFTMYKGLKISIILHLCLKYRVYIYQ